MVFEDRTDDRHARRRRRSSLTLAGVGSRFTAALIDYTDPGRRRSWRSRRARFGTAARRRADGRRRRSSSSSSSSSSSATTSRSRCSHSGRTPGKRLERAARRPASGGAGRLPDERRPQSAAPVDILPGSTSSASSRSSSTAEPAARRPRRRHARRAGAHAAPRPARRYVAAVRRAADIATWDTSAITADELDAVAAFLERRRELDPRRARQLARDARRRGSGRRSPARATTWATSVPRAARRREAQALTPPSGLLTSRRASAAVALDDVVELRTARRGAHARRPRRCAAAAGPARPPLPAADAHRRAVPALRDDDERRGVVHATCSRRSPPIPPARSRRRGGGPARPTADVDPLRVPTLVVHRVVLGLWMFELHRFPII